MHWAILSGIEGNLTAYEAVLRDLRRQRVTDLYVLGDVVGLGGDNEAVVARLQNPQPGELEPQVCLGWWEEQALNLAGVGTAVDAPELQARYGVEGVTQFWQSLSRSMVQWCRGLEFGFHELDCLLIHGSTVGCGDELGPETPAIQLRDRLVRADATTLFCGRSGRAFECWVTPSGLTSQVQTLDGPGVESVVDFTPRRVVGVGAVGHQPGVATYALFQPGSNQVAFRTVSYGGEPRLIHRQRGRGFGR